jgi:hypothetical protein
LAQVGGYCLAIGTAGAAAEVFDVIFCHVAQCINLGTRGGRRVAGPEPSLKLFSFLLVYDHAVEPAV